MSFIKDIVIVGCWVPKGTCEDAHQRSPLASVDSEQHGHEAPEPLERGFLPCELNLESIPDWSEI